jgi:hypothetical protein
MLELVLKNTSIPIDDSVTINVTNPALDNDNRGKTYTYPFKLKWTPQLLNKLKHARRFDAKVPVQNLKTTIKHHNIQIAKGDLKTNEGFQSTENSLSIHIKDDSNAILEKLQDVKLSDLCPKIVIPQVIEGKYKLTVPSTVTPGFNYFLDMNGNRYSYTPVTTQPIEVLTHLKDAINTDFPNAAVIINNSPGLELHIIPTDLFTPKIEQTVVGLSYIYAKNYSDSVQENFYNFLKSSYTTPRNDISFNFIRNVNFYDGKNLDIANHLNWVNPIFYQDNDWQVKANPPKILSSADEYFFSNTYLPFFRLSYIFTRILERLQLSGVVRCYGTPLWWSDVETLLIDNSYALDNIRKDWYWDNSGTEKYINCHVKEIDPSNHLPDMTAGKFLNDFADFLNLSYKIEGNDLVFSPKNKIFNNKAQKIDSYIKAHLRDYKDDNGYTMKFLKNDVELHTSLTELQEKKVGKGEEVIELPISTLFNDTTFETVHTDRRGGSLAFGIGKKAIPLRVFFSRPNSGYLGASNTGDFISLDINGTNGLYQTVWKGSAELRAGGYPLSIERVVTPQYFAKLITFENSKVMLLSDNGNVRAFASKITAKVTGKEKMIRAKIELIVG